METVKESGKSRDPEKHGSVRKEGNSTVGLWNMSKLIGGRGAEERRVGGGYFLNSETREEHVFLTPCLHCILGCVFCGSTVKTSML